MKGKPECLGYMVICAADGCSAHESSENVNSLREFEMHIQYLLGWQQRRTGWVCPRCKSNPEAGR